MWVAKYESTSNSSSPLFHEKLQFFCSQEDGTFFLKKWKKKTEFTFLIAIQCFGWILHQFTAKDVEMIELHQEL